MADSSAEQKRYVKFPIDSVQSCVDRLGLWASDEVSSGLAEDLNFRIRQITDVRLALGHNELLGISFVGFFFCFFFF